MIVESTPLLEGGRHPIPDLNDEVVYPIDVRRSIPKAGRSIKFSMLGRISLQKSPRGGGS